MIIVYSVSELYKPFFDISARSVLKHNPDAEIIVATKDDLYIPFKIMNIDVKRRCKGWGCWESDVKLFLTQLPFDKIIYLGADTFCQGSLKEMWDIPCDYINACKTHNYGKIQAQELGIPYYINVDSMVMNLDALRKDNFSEKVFERDDYPVSMWCNEETMINGRFNNKIKLLPQKFNYCYNRPYDNPMNYDDASIIHFIGKEKDNMLKYAKDKL